MTQSTTGLIEKNTRIYIKQSQVVPDQISKSASFSWLCLITKHTVCRFWEPEKSAKVNIEQTTVRLNLGGNLWLTWRVRIKMSSGIVALVTASSWLPPYRRGRGGSRPTSPGAGPLLRSRASNRDREHAKFARNSPRMGWGAGRASGGNSCRLHELISSAGRRQSPRRKKTTRVVLPPTGENVTRRKSVDGVRQTPMLTSSNIAHSFSAQPLTLPRRVILILLYTNCAR